MTWSMVMCRRCSRPMVCLPAGSPLGSALLDSGRHSYSSNTSPYVLTRATSPSWLSINSLNSSVRKSPDSDAGIGHHRAAESRQGSACRRADTGQPDAGTVSKAVARVPEQADKIRDSNCGSRTDVRKRLSRQRLHSLVLISQCLPQLREKRLQVKWHRRMLRVVAPFPSQVKRHVPPNLNVRIRQTTLQRRDCCVRERPESCVDAFAALFNWRPLTGITYDPGGDRSWKLRELPDERRRL